MSFQKNFLTVIEIFGVVGAGLVIAQGLYRLIKQLSDKRISEEEKQFKTVEAPYRYENLITYISIFKPLLERFNINPKDLYAFFDLKDAIIREGKIQSAVRIYDALKGDTLTQARRVIDEYTKLKDEILKLDFEYFKEETDSQPIYKGTIEAFVKEYRLEVLYENNPMKALESLVKEKFINFGKDLVLSRLEIPIKSLEKALKEGNIEQIEFDLSEIRKIAEQEASDKMV